MQVPTTTTPGDTRSALLYDANRKSAGLAYALWFFLGMVGGHRFYMGRALTGIVILMITAVSFLLMFVLVGFLTIAISGIWVLIDAFLIPGWVRDHNTRVATALTA